MANNVSLYGFRFVKTLTGRNVPNIVTKPVASAYQAAPSATNVDLNIGDPLQLLSTGYVSLAVENTEIYGFFAGCFYFDGQKMRYGRKLPGGTTYSSVEQESRVQIIPAFGNVFEVDCDENSTATTYAAYRALVGENADLSINQDGTSKEARPLLDISDHKTATAQFRLHEISDSTQNRDFSGERVKMFVTVNESSFKAGNDPSADGV